MKESDFQLAMNALQRVGAVYQRPYLPVPREAREMIYAESPSFAKLKEFLDPTNGVNPFNNKAVCDLLPSTCGDIGGGWFMWAVREAASRAGLHQSPTVAALFYRSVAQEVDAACGAGRLVCANRYLSLLPSMTREQWQRLPTAFLTALQLILYFAPPELQIGPSDLNAPDGAQALQFLNRPYHFEAVAEEALQTRAKLVLQSFAASMIRVSARAYESIMLIGCFSFLGAIFLAPRVTLRSAALPLIMALGVAVLARCAILALVDVSSFPGVYHERLLPAEPLAIACASLAMHLLFQAVRTNALQLRARRTRSGKTETGNPSEVALPGSCSRV